MVVLVIIVVSITGGRSRRPLGLWRLGFLSARMQVHVGSCLYLCCVYRRDRVSQLRVGLCPRLGRVKTVHTMKIWCLSQLGLCYQVREHPNIILTTQDYLRSAAFYP
jgi:hypothetical protein